MSYRGPSVPGGFRIYPSFTDKLRHCGVRMNHWLNMELDLQSLFGLHVTWCTQLLSLAETPQQPPALGLVDEGHRLNMELDLQSLFGLHVTWCAQLLSLAESPATPPPPAFGLICEGRYCQTKLDDISLEPPGLNWKSWTLLRANCVMLNTIPKTTNNTIVCSYLM